MLEMATGNPQLWFAVKINIIQQFLFFYLIDSDPWLLTPLFKVLPVIFQLGTGQHSIRLEKIILGCKFHILGIKTTLGQHIAKNLPVYIASCLCVHWLKKKPYRTTTCIVFLPEASIGLQVLSLPASVCPFVRQSVRYSVRHQVCPRDNSSPVQARITKFRP